MSTALLFVRFLAAATLVRLAVPKLLSVWAVVDASWRPRWLSRGRAGTAVRILCAWEIVLAYGVVLPPSRAVTAVAVACTGLGLTAVGARNIARSGSCGCSSARRMTRRTLLARNAAVFGGCLVGALWGADLGAPGAGPSGAVAALGFIPAGVLLALLIGRSRRVRRLTAALSGPPRAPRPTPTSA